MAVAALETRQELGRRRSWALEDCYHDDAAHVTVALPMLPTTMRWKVTSAIPP